MSNYLKEHIKNSFMKYLNIQNFNQYSIDELSSIIGDIEIIKVNEAGVEKNNINLEEINDIIHKENEYVNLIKKLTKIEKMIKYEKKQFVLKAQSPVKNNLDNKLKTLNLQSQNSVMFLLDEKRKEVLKEINEFEENIFAEYKNENTYETDIKQFIFNKCFDYKYDDAILYTEDKNERIYILIKDDFKNLTQKVKEKYQNFLLSYLIISFCNAEMNGNKNSYFMSYSSNINNNKEIEELAEELLLSSYVKQYSSEYFNRQEDEVLTDTKAGEILIYTYKNLSKLYGKNIINNKQVLKEVATVVKNCER